jgi:hypothetical protein
VNLLKNPVLKVVGLLALTSLFVAGCSEDPAAPDSNATPETYITRYGIATAPDSAALFAVTVHWRASDPDGRPEYYRYWVASGNETIISQTETFETSATVVLDFGNPDTTYTFNVQSRDSQNSWDASPAQIDIAATDVRDINAHAPETEPLTVPPNGAITSRGIPFVVNGLDVDGYVPEFQWTIDDTANWTTVPATFVLPGVSTLELEIGPSAISFGAHIFYIRSVDVWGNVDPSPLSVSFNATAGFAPELTMSVREGESFVVPFTEPTIEALVINFTATVDFYYGAIKDYIVATSSGLRDTTTDPSVTLANVSEGDYWIAVTATDIGGNATTDTINFSVAVLNAHQGILGINGIDWATYTSQATDVWENAVAFGNFPHFKWWDLFLVPPSGGRPFGDSLLGTGAPLPWMFDTTFFSAVVWCANEFGGDETFWLDFDTDGTIMNYLNNGGNLILATRFAHDFFFPDLDAFSGTNPDNWLIGANPAMADAVGDSLTDISRIGSHSFTDLPAVSSPTTRILYVDPAHTEYALGFLAEPAGAGKFFFLAGRNYRWTGADLKANLDVIYRYYFGMRDEY